MAQITPPFEREILRALFTKPYGAPAPTAEQWRAMNAETVHFQDPTQERRGINPFIAAQEGLLKLCDDVFLAPGTIAVDSDVAFVEWTMGLRIRGRKFTSHGTSRLLFGADGKILDHRDYFDVVGPTFAPLPMLGPFTRWLYRRFAV